MTDPINIELFNQASSQLNFLLLSQRNMILVSAFSIALANFSIIKNYEYFKYYIFFLYIFAIATGVKALQDFKKFIIDTKDEPTTNSKEKDLLDNWLGWIYYSYALIFVISLIFGEYLLREFFKIETQKIKSKKK